MLERRFVVQDLASRTEIGVGMKSDCLVWVHAVFVVGAFVTTSHAAAACGLQNASYALVGAPTLHAKIEVGHQPGKGRLKYLVLDDRQHGQRRYFAFDRGNGVTETMALSASEPISGSAPKVDPDSAKNRALPDMPAYFFDNRLAVIDRDPETFTEAPPYLFLPSLASSVWYSISGSGEGRIKYPVAMFVMSCRK